LFIQAAKVAGNPKGGQGLVGQKHERVGRSRIPFTTWVSAKGQRLARTLVACRDQEIG